MANISLNILLFSIITRVHSIQEVQSRSDTITKLEEWKDRTETERNQATIRHTSDHQRVMGQLNKVHVHVH